MADVMDHINGMISSLKDQVDFIVSRMKHEQLFSGVNLNRIKAFYVVLDGYNGVDYLSSEVSAPNYVVSNILRPAVDLAREIGADVSESNDSSEALRSLGEGLCIKCSDIRGFLDGFDSSKSVKLGVAANSQGGVVDLQQAYDELKLGLESCERQVNELRRWTTGIDNRIIALGQHLDRLNEVAKAEIDKIKSIYDEGFKEIELKRHQVDGIVERIANRVIAGDFANSAAEEKKMADWLRYASIGCMAVIIAALGYSFWETTREDFEWQKSIFRASLAFLLSVPAAYLARESAKHRQQQYQHLQTSLDLKAISPYIASLPEGEQHKLKIEMASRIFAARDFSKVGADPYPLNTHEIIMELIKKLEFSRSDSKKPDSQ